MSKTKKTTTERSNEDLRNELLEKASELLQGEGVEEFSTTKIAESCDTSRQMIYTLFGGKPELIQAVYDYKSKELAERFDEIDEDDPVDQFFELGRVYRDFMLEHAALFDTVFSLEATRKYSRPGSIVERLDAHDRFDEALEDCQEAGILPDDTDIEELTELLWAGVNGVLRLQLVDFYPDEETAREQYFKVATNIISGESNQDITY